ncbi:MAG: DNA-3-methyladenine glycosylase [Planctomycetota bacterium]
MPTPDAHRGVPAGVPGEWSWLVDRASIVGPKLLGNVVVRTLDDGTRLAGRIVEVEAYEGPEDQASHARNGLRTDRNESMYRRAGTSYVYFTYGMHYCMNVACFVEGVPHGVLVRGLEPVEGLERMTEHRRARSPKARLRDRDLTNGPAKLTQALGIDREFDRHDLLKGRPPLHLERGGLAAGESVASGVRIGLRQCGEWRQLPWRWWIAESAYVSPARV